jgi:hypothetical protein
MFGLPYGVPGLRTGRPLCCAPAAARPRPAHGTRAHRASGGASGAPCMAPGAAPRGRSPHAAPIRWAPPRAPTPFPLPLFRPRSMGLFPVGAGRRVRPTAPPSWHRPKEARKSCTALPTRPRPCRAHVGAQPGRQRLVRALPRRPPPGRPESPLPPAPAQRLWSAQADRNRTPPPAPKHRKGTRLPWPRGRRPAAAILHALSLFSARAAARPHAALLPAPRAARDGGGGCHPRPHPLA